MHSFCPCSFGLSSTFFNVPAGSERESRSAIVRGVAAVCSRCFADFAGISRIAGCVPAAFRRGVIERSCWRLSAGKLDIRRFWVPPPPLIALTSDLQADGGAVSSVFTMRCCWGFGNMGTPHAGSWYRKVIVSKRLVHSHRDAMRGCGASMDRDMQRPVLQALSVLAARVPLNTDAVSNLTAFPALLRGVVFTLSH